MLFWCLEKSLCVSSVISESIIVYLQVDGWYCLLSRHAAHLPRSHNYHLPWKHSTTEEVSDDASDNVKQENVKKIPVAQ